MILVLHDAIFNVILGYRSQSMESVGLDSFSRERTHDVPCKNRPQQDVTCEKEDNERKMNQRTMKRHN